MVPSVATEKIPSDTTGNRSRDRPTSSTVLTLLLEFGIKLETYFLSKTFGLLASAISIKDNAIRNKFYSHQLMHFFIQLCISLLSYIKIT